MKELDETLIRDWLVPSDFKTRIIYHYTTAAGLLGILSSGVLRGTNAPFLNDTSEIAYGLSVCLEMLEDERASRASEPEKQLIERVAGLIRDDTLPNEVYVTSFCSRRDVLSQWRAYGSDAGRFCLGFQLSQFSERNVLHFPQRVEYDRNRQRSRVNQAVAIACTTLLESPDDARHAWSCVSSLAMHLRRLMCAFKHAGFAEEEEWRSVTTISQEEVAYVGFEATAGALRPYTTMLAGSRTSARLPVVEVCIGHAARKKATFRATQLLLTRYGYGDARVTETEIPFAG